MQADLKQLEQRIKGLWYRDGIGDFAGGIVFFLIGAYFALVEALGDNAPWGGLLQAAFILVFIGLIYFGRRLVTSLKTRYVYPRTGYVEYRADKEQRAGTLIAAGVLAAIIAVFIVLATRIPGILNWLVVITGALVGLMLVFIQLRVVAVRRFYFYSMVSMMLGITCGLSGWPEGYALGAYYAAMGLIFVITGVVVWQGFMNENPLPET